MPPPVRAAARFDIGYRPFTEADLDFVRTLFRSTREEEVAQTGWPEAAQKAFIDQQFDAQHRHYLSHYGDAEWLIVTRRGEPIGRLYLFEDEREFLIIDVTIAPQARGAGIGAAILEDIFALAAPTGKRVAIHVEKNNPARRLYSRVGFRMAEDQGIYDLMVREPAEPEEPPASS
jgi:GNAT superfamily N-acetyltransferase